MGAMITMSKLTIKKVVCILFFLLAQRLTFTDFCSQSKHFKTYNAVFRKGATEVYF